MSTFPELRQVRYLLAVAEYGGFTRAAERLHVSQPTLSQQVRRLERTVGAPLLDRTRHGVRLTDAGAAYAQHARGALRELTAAGRAAAPSRRVTLLERESGYRGAATRAFSALAREVVREHDVDRRP